MLDLRDFKRIFSFVSFVMFIINISNNKTTSADELVLLMFMISNVLTVFGLTLKERWNHSYRDCKIVCVRMNDSLNLFL